MRGHDRIVIGTSAGGVQALCELVSKLPPSLKAAIFIVLHIPRHSPSLLPSILSRQSRLPVTHAQSGEEIKLGRIYVAPPDQHLLIEDGYMKLVHGPRENLHRPSIDALFRSAARAAGLRTVGVVLTGTRDDGKAGMRAIQKMGGATVVQDPRDATFPGLPLNIINEIDVDYTVPLVEIPPLLVHLTQRAAPLEGSGEVPEEIEIESKIAEQEMESDELIDSVKKIGRISTLTCPECNGALWEMNDDEMLRYRCHVGHAFSMESLNEGHAQMLETALWSALRALDEKLILSKRMAQHAENTDRPAALRLLQQRVKQTEEQAAIIRQVLLSYDRNHQFEVAVSG